MRKKIIEPVLALIGALVLSISSTPVTLAVPPSQSLSCMVDYTVQTGDSISRVAQKYYGEVLGYAVIVEATNRAAQENDRYAPIANANVIEVGQVLCVPDSADAEGILNQQPAPQNVVEQQPVPAPQQVVPQPISFSQDSSLIRQPIQLNLSYQGSDTIRYTTNGSPPGATSPAYTGPINISQPTVIRAQLFDQAGNPTSDIQTKSYIIPTYEQSIPVISIAADWTHLDTLHAFPDGRGKEWERPINMEWFGPGGQIQLNAKAGIRIHGNFSRLFNPKKSYRIYFRKEYGGQDAIEFPFFPDSTARNYDKLVLRALFQDSFTHRGIPDRSDRHGTAKYISDQVVRNLHKKMGQPIAHGRWVLLYLNGEFWGLYNLTERIDLQFFQAYSDPDSNWDVIAKESGFQDGIWYSREVSRDGNYGGWLDNQNWVGSTDFFIPENIGDLEWRVDMENVFSYMFLLAYVQNTEWPSSNWVVYQRTDPDILSVERKWRMLIWDAEDSFGGGEGGRMDLNTLVRVHSPHDSITRLLEKPFIGNCGFKHRFVNRAREYLGVENPTGRPENEVGQLSKERVKAEILEQAAIVRPFIQMETERWAPDLPGVQIFEQNIQNALTFVDVREEVILNHLDILRYQTFTECK